MVACYTGEGTNTPLLGGVFFQLSVFDLPIPSSPALGCLRPFLRDSKATMSFYPARASHPIRMPPPGLRTSTPSFFFASLPTLLPPPMDSLSTPSLGPLLLHAPLFKDYLFGYKAQNHTLLQGPYQPTVQGLSKLLQGPKPHTVTRP